MDSIHCVSSRFAALCCFAALPLSQPLRACSGSVVPERTTVRLTAPAFGWPLRVRGGVTPVLRFERLSALRCTVVTSHHSHRSFAR